MYNFVAALKPPWHRHFSNSLSALALRWEVPCWGGTFRESASDRTADSLGGGLNGDWNYSTLVIAGMDFPGPGAIARIKTVTLTALPKVPEKRKAVSEWPHTTLDYTFMRISSSVIYV